MQKTINELLNDIGEGIKNLRYFDVKPKQIAVHDNVVSLQEYRKPKLNISKEDVDALLKEAIHEVNSGTCYSNNPQTIKDK